MKKVILVLSCAIGAVLMFLLTSCENDLADEDAPFDDRSNLDEQGLYDCSEHDATGYRNGTPFAIKTVTVDGKPLQVDTANAYIALQAAAQHDGISLRVVSGFRTMAEQQYLYHCYQTGSCNGGNLAAVPGYSNHQSGHAIDMNTSDGGVYSWLENHAAHFGWYRTVPSEIWHWEWWGSHSDYPGPCGGPQLPPHCESGHWSGDFCDDDGHADAHDHDRLKSELGVSFHCGDMNGHPAFCGDKDATRADAIFVLGAAAHMPLDGHPDAFVDDNGNPREKYFDAAHAYGIMLGYAGKKVKPNNDADRNDIASMLVRMYKLPKVNHDYFFDDDGDSHEDAHNRVAAAGLLVGYADAHHTRNKFDGAGKATHDTLATVALRAHDKGLVPVWAMPADCVSGNYQGAFCDDDGRGDEAAIDALAANVPWACADVAASPAFCPDDKVSRAEAAYALLKAAGVPMSTTYADGFVDDDGNSREKFLDAAKAWGVLLGYDGGKDVKPNKVADRNTIATMLVRLYRLPDPPAGTPDAFTDDDGSADESMHDKVAYAGLFTGYPDGHGGKKFSGSDVGTKSMIATLVSRAVAHQLVPVWQQTTIAPAPAPTGSSSSSSSDPPASDEDAPGTNSDDEGIGDPLPGDGPLLDDGYFTNQLGVDDGDQGESLAAPDEGPPPGLATTTTAVKGGCASTSADANAIGLALLPAAYAFARFSRLRRSR